MSGYVWDLSGTDKQCASYAPGHLIHWIHFNHSMREPSPVIPVTAVVDDDGLVHIDGDDLSLVRWNHRPALLRDALHRFGGMAVWKPRWYMLAVPTEAFIGGARTVFSLAAPDERRGCSVHRATNPEHLVPSTPSPTNVSPLRIAARYADGGPGLRGVIDGAEAWICGVVMSDDFDAVLPMGRSCGSYRIGHQVHWIQGLRSAGATVVIRVSVAVHPNGLVQLRGDGLSLECWNHTPAAIQASLPRNPDHAVVWWKPEWHVLSFSAHGGGSFSLALLDERTPCHPGARQAPGESTSDFVARAMREDHGYTVPLRSVRGPDVVADEGTQ